MTGAGSLDMMHLAQAMTPAEVKPARGSFAADTTRPPDRSPTRMARTPRTRRFLPATPWWVLLFFVVGVGATLAAGVGLFLSAGRRPPIYGAPHLGAVTDDDFLKAVGGATDTSVHDGGTVALLNNGEQFYPAIVDAIRSARRSVTSSSSTSGKRARSAPGDSSARSSSARAPGRDPPAAGWVRRGAGADRPKDWSCGRSEARSPSTGPRDSVCSRGFIATESSPGHRGRRHRSFTGGTAMGDKWKGSASNPQEWRDSMVRSHRPIGAQPPAGLRPVMDKYHG